MSDSSTPVGNVTFATYDRIISDRPFKLSPEEVGYKDAEGEERCSGCVHFYTRKLDGWAVCEIMRDMPGDDPEYERPINPDYVCRFMTPDSLHWPLLEQAQEPSSSQES